MSLSLAPTSARARRGAALQQRRYKGGSLSYTAPLEDNKHASWLESQGIRFHYSKYKQRCQLCRWTTDKFRRKCPICERYMAPNCKPISCWKDEVNHCRICHTLIGTLKHIRFKIQFMNDDMKKDELDIQSKGMSYKDLPLGVQVNIMLFLFQVKDFIWSPHLNVKYVGTQKCECPICQSSRSQSTDNKLCYLPEYPTSLQSGDDGCFGI